MRNVTCASERDEVGTQEEKNVTTKTQTTIKNKSLKINIGICRSIISTMAIHPLYYPVRTDAVPTERPHRRSAEWRAAGSSRTQEERLHQANAADLAEIGTAYFRNSQEAEQTDHHHVLAGVRNSDEPQFVRDRQSLTSGHGVDDGRWVLAKKDEQHMVDLMLPSVCPCRKPQGLRSHSFLSFRDDLQEEFEAPSTFPA